MPRSPINIWQYVDDSNGLIFPNYTRPFLEILRTWEMEDWDIFEWGSGHSTIWFGSRCKSLVSVDHSAQQLQAVQSQLDDLNAMNVTLKLRSPSAPYEIDHGGEASSLVKAIDEDDRFYDCIIINGSFHRNACAVYALKHIKKYGVIILNNANQASAGINSWPTFKLLNEYEHYSIWQPGHPDWRTDYWLMQ